MRTLLTAGGALAVLAAAPGTLNAAQYDAADPTDLVYVEEDCTQGGAQRAGARRSGPLSWLVRGGREDREDEEPDAEAARYGGTVSYYLRSPLLTSLFSTVPCPEKRAEAEVEPAAAPVAEAETCALLVIRGREGEEQVELRLPFMGATTASRLRAVISEYQARGEPLLVPYAYAETELAASAIREVRPGRC